MGFPIFPWAFHSFPMGFPLIPKKNQARHALAKEFAAPEPHKWGRWGSQKAAAGRSDLGVGMGKTNSIQGAYTFTHISIYIYNRIYLYIYMIKYTYI